MENIIIAIVSGLIGGIPALVGNIMSNRKSTALMEYKIDKLDEIFSWYNQHKGMVLHANTRKLVEEILEDIKKELDSE